MFKVLGYVNLASNSKNVAVLFLQTLPAPDQEKKTLSCLAPTFDINFETIGRECPQNVALESRR